MKLVFEEFSFPAAHYIPGQGGKCEGVHGHNYFVRDLTIETEQSLNRVGMIIDFGVIKDYFKERWDHKLIVPVQDQGKWFNFLKDLGALHNVVGLQHTTCEWMHFVMTAELYSLLRKHGITESTITFSLHEGPKQGVAA